MSNDPGAAAQRTLAVTALRAATQEIVELKQKVSALEVSIAKKDHVTGVLLHSIELINARLNALEDTPNDSFTSGTTAVGGQEQAGNQEGEEDPGKAQIRKKIASEEAAESRVVKTLVNKMFIHLLGISKLEKKYLPDFPLDLDPKDEGWPKDPATSHPYIRFDWAHPQKADAPVNRKAIDEILAFTRVHGSDEAPLAKQHLDAILNSDLRQRITIKFNNLRLGYLTHQKEQHWTVAQISGFIKVK
ncbi:hypothetical protein QCA50_008829 [Cerrena zonata]|uniref:Uncharacterized protein n=1 Tax=Cerrena zonata TaxID=2478898 RepID=A0AAW0G288_9APHY